MEIELTVPWKNGLHLRRAGEIYRMISKFNHVTVSIIDKNGESCSCSAINLLLLGAAKGTKVKFIIEPDNKNLKSELKQYFIP